jgi:hypothetical protein
VSLVVLPEAAALSGAVTVARFMHRERSILTAFDGLRGRMLRAAGFAGQRDRPSG